jgi:hypothetical protein
MLLKHRLGEPKSPLFKTIASQFPLGRICVHENTYGVPLNPKELQDLLDKLEASRRSRKRAWENLQEIRWVLKDATRMLPESSCHRQPERR